MDTEYSPEVIAQLTTMLGESLPCWGISQAAKIKLLNLSENATFSVYDAENDKALIIRVQRKGYSSYSEIQSELAWINALIKDGIINTATPVASITGDPVVLMGEGTDQARYAVAFTRLPGNEPVPGNDLAHWFEIIGELTANMHNHARQWKRPEVFERKLWNFDSMVGENPYWGPWQESMGLDEEGKKVITKTLSHVSDKLKEYGDKEDVFGLVHADLRMANLLVDGDLLQVIDFDDCGFCWYLYDFAASLSFIENEPGASELLQAWIKGYSKVTLLDETSLSMLPVFSIMRRVLLTAWLASHSEIPFAIEMGEQFTFDTVSLCKQFLSGTYLKAAEA